MTPLAVLVLNVGIRHSGQILNVYKQYDEALRKYNNSIVRFYFLYHSTDFKYLKNRNNELCCKYVFDFYFCDTTSVKDLQKVWFPLILLFIFFTP